MRNDKKSEDRGVYAGMIVMLVLCTFMITASTARRDYRQPPALTYEQELEKIHDERMAEFVELEKIRAVIGWEEIDRRGTEIGNRRLTEINALRERHRLPPRPPALNR